MEKSLYVITHKELDNKIPNGRKIMLVGAYNKNLPKGYLSDFSKENQNISEKNSSFCELTGLYYFSKYDNSEILGLEHYRRFFVNDKFHIFKYHYLKDNQIEKILEEYDIILPKVSKLKMSVKSQYEQDHFASDLVELRNVIQELTPEYLKSFDLSIASDRVYFCNMMIGKAEIIKAYSDWLFKILFELEKRIDISDRDNYQKRVFGFISERLLMVFLNHNKEIKIKEKPIIFIEDKNPFINQVNRVLRKIKKIFKRK